MVRADAGRNARTIRARRPVQRRCSACFQSARGSAGSLCGLLVARSGEPSRRAGLGPADLSRGFDELFARRISPIRLACRAARRKPERSDLWWPFRRFGSARAGESISWIHAPVWRPAEPSGRAGAVEPRHRERVPDGATAIRGRTTCLADRTPTDHRLFGRRDRHRRRQVVRVGVGRFGIQSAGFLGDLREALASGAQHAADYLAPGSAPDVGTNVSDYLASYPLLRGPTSSQLQSAVESYTGSFYQPKTIVGDYAQTAGEFVPGALLMPEGRLAANALRYGLLPALSSETAGQLTKGTAAEPWARAAGGILGAAASTWRALPRVQSAPAVAKPLAPPVFDPIAQLRLNAEAGRAAEEAVGIPANVPKPSIRIPGSGKRRFPDRLTEKTLEEVKNVQYLALTQQIRDYLAYAKANQLTFILHVHPETEYSGPLQQLVDSGQIIDRDIERLSK